MTKQNKVENTHKEKETDVQILINEREVSVKQYLPISEKISLAQSAIDSSVNEEGYIDYNKIEIACVNLIIMLYTDFEVSGSTLEFYDKVVSLGVFDLIEQGIPVKELKSLERVLQNSIKTYENIISKKNSFEGVIQKTINDVKDYILSNIGNIPTAEEIGEIAKLIPKELEQLNPENLQFITDFIKTVDTSTILK